ncbi:putative epoxide hydrolase [Podospora australis]|uniref:Epoxide hydrolase n=1 Tax=Podospora australis TaxID=1536484 RepID=A0AAN7ADP4_9PEZI|nr:putative epoxide hydrolase [Podospora australis]
MASSLAAALDGLRLQPSSSDNSGNKKKMNLSAFGFLPAGIPGTPTPFTYHVPNRDVHRVNTLVSLADIGTPAWYNQNAYAPNGTFGVSREWLADAQASWLDDFDWRQHEERHNSVPNFKINITTPSDGQLFDIHFAALFSKKADATPILLMHGWPGTWMEFLPMMELLGEKYTPETLPYNVIVPSIPDYGLSTRRNEDRELTMEVAAEAMNELMVQLGFNAYVAQGGDVGSFLAQHLSGSHEECKAFHLNMLFLNPTQTAAVANLSVTPEEQGRLGLAQAWASTGSAYANEHGTRPSTLSLVLQTNPLAMLAWMGEKFIEWSDNRKPLSLDTILSMVSYYWYTKSYGRSLWAYRSLTRIVGGALPDQPISLTKPFGFSAFPVEIATLPRSWADHLFPNLVFYGVQDEGGHFAALQVPEAFLKDIEEFVAIVKPNVTTSA